MALWLDALSTVVGVVALGFALLLFWRGARSLSTIVLASWLSLLGLFYLLIGLGAHLGIPPFALGWLMFFSTVPRPYLVAAFGFVFLRQVLSARTRAALVAIAAVALVHGSALVFFPRAFVLPGGVATEFGAMIFTTAIAASYVLAVGALGGRWLRAPPGTYRRQLLWGLLPFLFWTVHDGIGFGVLPAILGTRVGELVPWFVLYAPAPHVLALWLTGLLIVAVLAAVALRRTAAGGAQATDGRVLFFAAIYAVPLSLVQLFDPGFHGPVDALIVPILAYGVARYQVADLDLRLRWTVKQGSLAGIVLAVFFLVTEVSKEVLTDRVGWSPYLGIIAASMLLFALSPLQRLAERVASAATPHVTDRVAHVDARTREIYRVAAEELLVDGHVSEKERAALLRLRAQLGMDASTAARIEADVRQALPAPG